MPLRVLALHIPLFFFGILGFLQNHEDLVLLFWLMYAALIFVLHTP